MNFGIFPSRSDMKKGSNNSYTKKRSFTSSSSNRNNNPFEDSTARNADGGADGNNKRSANGNKNGVTVISVVENRAREICIAKFDTEAGSTVEIYLLTDSHSYTETLSIIEDLEPNEILLHDGCKNKVLSQKVEDAAMNLLSDEPRVLYISRQYFDQDKGADMLKNVLVGYVDADLVAKYTVLAGTYCLLKYIENCEGIHFATHSLRMVYSNSIHSKLNIDRRTAINLELISNSKNGNQKTSLYGTINFTKTKVGSRFLKSNLLRPSTDITTIETRLDTVELLLKHTKEFNNLVSLLQSFPDLDKMLYGLVTLPKQLTIKTVRCSIDTLIYLKATLKLCPQMIQVLQSLSSSTSNTIYTSSSSSSSSFIDFTNNNNSSNTDSNNNNNSTAATTTTTSNNNNNNINSTSTTQMNLLVETLMGNFSDPYFTTLQTNIDRVITDSTVYSKSPHEMRYQECFAVKSGIDSILDLARKSFLQHVEDIYILAEEYSKQFNINSVKVVYTTSRGYHLSLQSPNSISRHEHQEKNDDVLATFLPPIFIQAVLSKRTIACTTEEVSSLASRAAEAIQQALALTHECIQTHIMSEIRASQKMEGLYALTDSIALLDMLTSFADLVALSPHTYTRPKVIDDSNNIVTNISSNVSGSSVSGNSSNINNNSNSTAIISNIATNTANSNTYNTTITSTSVNTTTAAAATTTIRPSPLVIHAGCHPILNEKNIQKTTNTSFQPNDTYFSELNNFLIITGPNSSGKTVFIKQIALMVVLAQIGCFVPARHATIPIRDRILTRLGTSDDMEHNLSTFMTEMKETTYILNNVTDRSLVIIDELGRGTSNIDGLSLAFSIAEYLIGNTNAYCMFVTHYAQITTLASMYPNVSNIHLKVALTYTESNNSSGNNSNSINSSSSSSQNSSSSNNRNFNSNNQQSQQQQQQQQSRECIKFTHQVGSGASELKDGYGILMSELFGFPHSMIQEARNIQKIVRNLYPLYLNHNDIDPSVGVVTTLLQHLILLKNSTLNDGVLCQYLDNIRNKISEKMVDGIGLYLQHFNKSNVVTAISNNSSSDNHSTSTNSHRALVSRDHVSTTTATTTSTATATIASSTLVNNVIQLLSSQQQQQQQQQQQRGPSCLLTDPNISTNLMPPSTIDNRSRSNNVNNSNSNNNGITPANNSRYHTTTSTETSPNDAINSTGKKVVTFDIETDTNTINTRKPTGSITKDSNDMNDTDSHSNIKNDQSNKIDTNCSSNSSNKQPAESIFCFKRMTKE